MFNNIVISGVSGVGKTTLVDSLSKKYNVYREIKDSHSLTFWYDKSTSNSSTKHFAKNIMLASRLSYCYSNLSVDGVSIHDRGLIDLLVSNDLRIKDRNKDFYDDFRKEIIESINSVKENKSIKQFYILLGVEFDEFKERILKRARGHEVSSINSDDSWYRKYHSQYINLTIKYLEEFSVPYFFIDTTNLSSEETNKLVEQKISEINF